MLSPSVANCITMVNNSNTPTYLLRFNEKAKYQKLYFGIKKTTDSSSLLNCQDPRDSFHNSFSKTLSLAAVFPTFDRLSTQFSRTVLIT